MKADNKKINRKLNIAKGQLEGIQKMVSEDAYCLDISNQLLATMSLLKNVNNDIISAHLNHWILTATEADLKAKLSEIETLLKRIS